MRYYGWKTEKEIPTSLEVGISFSVIRPPPKKAWGDEMIICS